MLIDFDNLSEYDCRGRGELLLTTFEESELTGTDIIESRDEKNLSGERGPRV